MLVFFFIFQNFIDGVLGKSQVFLRFSCDFEKQANSKIVETLAPLADLFVNDAFAAAHRCQPSLVGFSERMPALAGRVMQRELDFLGKAISSGPSPRIALLGGSKAADSVSISKYFLKKGIDYVLTGGVVANVFLLAAGIDIGEPSKTFVQKNIPDYENIIKKAKSLIDEYGERIVYPTDVAINDNGQRVGVSIDQLPTNHPIHDIGLDTLVKYINLINNAGTIIANGPMGVFENPLFSTGTNAIASAIIQQTKQGAVSIIGGGDTISSVKSIELKHTFTHISTGGGASLKFLSGLNLPAIEGLRNI